MSTRTATALVLLTLCGLAVLDAAERAWQTGTLQEVTIDRPKVNFGVQSRDPSSNLPRAVPSREIRTYIVHTDSLRLELRQDATADTPRLDVRIGEPVTFALDKKTVYMKDDAGKEHKLSLRKQTSLPATETK
jgi:hypothetical protein